MVDRSGWSELFVTAFRQSRSPMVLLDDPRLVVDANGALLRLLGHARGDVIGKPGYERGAKRTFFRIAWSRRPADSSARR